MACTAMACVEEKKSRKKNQVFDESRAFLENLPFDSVIEMEILPRLPLKSIVQLEFASKPLFPLISDHLRRHYSLPNSVSGLFFSSPISKTPTKNFYHALDNKFVIDGTLSTLPSEDNLGVVDSCNGLLLCKCRKINQGYRGLVLFVCNPLTGQCASIPVPNTFLNFLEAVLAFDPRVSGHYNLLCFSTGYIDVFSSETGSWVQKKQRASHSTIRQRDCPFFFKGKIYLPSYKCPFVKVFDLQGKSCGKINLPPSERPYLGMLLGHCGDHLHFVHEVDGKMLVWILEDCKKSLWVLKHNINLRPIFDHAGLLTVDYKWYYPRAFHPDMDVIFMEERYKLISYNMNNGDITEVCTLPGISNSIFVYSPCYSKDFDL